MAVKIRLKRLGKIRAPYYRIGKYNPTVHPSFIEVDSDRAQYWLSVGAQPTEQVAAILKLSGDWAKFKGEKDTESKILAPEPKAVFEADASKKPVLRPKAEKVVEAPKAEEAVAEAPAAEAEAENSEA